jgi:hypothetical protein
MSFQTRSGDDGWEGEEYDVGVPNMAASVPSFPSIHEANVAAFLRDYHLNPRLGM